MLKAMSVLKKFFALVMAVSMLLLSVAVHAQQDQSTATFTSKEGAFSVSLPETPKENTEDMNSNNGPTTLHTFMVERDEGRRFFLVGYSDYQNKLDATASLTSVIDGQAESLKGKITVDKTVTLAGYPGRSVTIESEGIDFYSTVYVAGNRLYQIMCGVPKVDAMPADAKAFFDSFRILM